MHAVHLHASPGGGCMHAARDKLHGAHQVSDAGVVQQLEAFGDDEGMSC